MATNVRRLPHSLSLVRTTPPQVSFLRLKTTIRAFKNDGIPVQVDGASFDDIAPLLRAHLVAAMQFLGLLEDGGFPTAGLKALVVSYGTTTWHAQLETVLTSAYRGLFDAGIPLTSPSQFMEAFQATYGGTEDVLRKCRTFFLHAALEAGLELSPSLFSGIKPRIVQARPRAAQRHDTPLQMARRPAETHPPAPAKMSEMLIDRLDPDAMTPKVQEAIWLLLRYFKARDD